MLGAALNGMVQILHISDPHGESETMGKLDGLARTSESIDVIACTGDSASYSSPIVPALWNAWPQRLKLAVPGNHCHPNTYQFLTSWRTSPPYATVYRDLLFLGLYAPANWATVTIQLTQCHPSGQYSGVVVLSHTKPDLSLDSASEQLTRLVGSRPVLLLHGHDHPRDRRIPEWEIGFRFSGLQCARSKVYSAAGGLRGIGAVIRWDGAEFAPPVYRIFSLR
jgi:hypothetical protein